MSAVLVCDGQLTFDSAMKPSCRYPNGTNAWQAAPTDSIFVAKLFEPPEVADLQAAFMASFSLIMIIHLTTWAYGHLINWFDDRKNQN